MLDFLYRSLAAAMDSQFGEVVGVLCIVVAFVFVWHAISSQPRAFVLLLFLVPIAVQAATNDAISTRERLRARITINRARASLVRVWRQVNDDSIPWFDGPVTLAGVQR